MVGKDSSWKIFTKEDWINSIENRTREGVTQMEGKTQRSLSKNVLRWSI